MKYGKVIFILIYIVSCFGCTSSYKVNGQVIPGANCFDDYLPLLKDKRVALLVNQSSLVDGVHLVDTLLSSKINIAKIFAPEHGFRGTNDAGEQVIDNIDSKTGLTIISLFGNKKKPGLKQMQDIDVVVFDIQDVGVRFYTFISTMHYMMEACAETSKKLIILDRPNPNGDYFAGPVLQPEFRSFVGMDPIPVVHGLTVGELAKMINEERWLEDSLYCDLRIIKMKNWNHDTVYELPVKPSPNLPNYTSIRLYPSLCFFEATNVSIGRGTYFPFQVIGFPNKEAGEFSFIPKSIIGMAKSPKQMDKICYGIDLREEDTNHKFTLSCFLTFYKSFGQLESFGLNEKWFNLLAGNDQLIRDIKAGASIEEIELSWQQELLQYSLLRDKYLLYAKEHKD